MVRADDLERGREQSAAGSWADAHAALSRADGAAPLPGDDLELLARSAYMLGRDDEYRATLERAYRAHLEAGDSPRAARCAWWVGHNFMFRGDSASAAGWFARGLRVLERPGGRAQRARARPRGLPRRRGPPPAGAVRGRRGRLPRGDGARAGAAAGARAPAAGAGERRCRGGGHSACSRRDDAAAEARGAPARVRADHDRVLRPGGGRGRLSRAGGIAERQGSQLLGAAAAEARGEVELAEGDTQQALRALRRACE